MTDVARLRIVANRPATHDRAVRRRRPHLREFIVKGFVRDDERLKMIKRRMSTPHHSQVGIGALGSYA